MGVILTTYKSWDDPPRRNCVLLPSLFTQSLGERGVFPYLSTKRGVPWKFLVRLPCQKSRPSGPASEGHHNQTDAWCELNMQKVYLGVFVLVSENFMYFMCFFWNETQQKIMKNMPQNDKNPKTPIFFRYLPSKMFWNERERTLRIPGAPIRCTTRMHWCRRNPWIFRSLTGKRSRGMKVAFRFFWGLLKIQPNGW